MNGLRLNGNEKNAHSPARIFYLPDQCINDLDFSEDAGDLRGGLGLAPKIKASISGYNTATSAFCCLK